jgi:hypothetical protein
MGLITFAQRPWAHSWEYIGGFTGIGSLAIRFGMDKLDHWIQSQLVEIFDQSTRKLADALDKEILIRLITYMPTTRSTAYRQRILMFIQFTLCKLIIGFTSPGQVSPNLSMFVDLYKNQSLQANNAGLFGFIFAAILSLGHRSSIWTDQLTRDDRTILYAAYADLTQLCDHTDLDVGWLAQPAKIKDPCHKPNCAQNFEKLWKSTFAVCKNLNSPVPLEDIRQIVRLPLHRQSFVDRGRSWTCECAQNTLAKIDSCIDRLFCGLAEKYKHWARWVLIRS